MAYVTQQARRELLDTVAEATDELGAALAALGAARRDRVEGGEALEDAHGVVGAENVFEKISWRLERCAVAAGSRVRRGRCVG